MSKSHQELDSPTEELHISSETVIMCLVAIFVVFLDAALTYIGVDQNGIPSEGNPLIRELMERFGVIPTLLASRVAILLIVPAMAILMTVHPRTTYFFKAIILLYLILSVGGWSAVLWTGPLLRLLCGLL